MARNGGRGRAKCLRESFRVVWMRVRSRERSGVGVSRLGY